MKYVAYFSEYPNEPIASWWKSLVDNGIISLDTIQNWCKSCGYSVEVRLRDKVILRSVKQ